MQLLNKIEHLYKNEFKDFEQSLNFEEINFLDKLIMKNAFYKFNPYQFNVFYAMAIVSGFFVTISSSVYYVYSQADFRHQLSIASIETPIKKSTKNNLILTEIKTVNKKIKQSNQDKKNSNSTILLNQKTIKKDKNEFSTNTVKNSSVLDFKNNFNEVIPINCNEPQNTSPEVINPHRKIVYIIKKDTIFQIDTVRIIKNQ